MQLNEAEKEVYNYAFKHNLTSEQFRGLGLMLLSLRHLLHLDIDWEILKKELFENE